MSNKNYSEKFSPIGLRFSLFWWRKWHAYGAMIVALPLLVIILSGILLMLRKEISWLAPSSVPSETSGVSLTPEDVFQLALSWPEAGVKTWDDIKQIRYLPSQGTIIVRTKNYYQLQIDGHQKKILGAGKRWSDLLMTIHEGTWFHSRANYFIFLPTALVLFFLWVSGIYLFFASNSFRRRKQNSCLLNKNKLNQKKVLQA